MSRPPSLANQSTSEYLKSIRASPYSPRKATIAVHVTTTRHAAKDNGISSPQGRTRVHEMNGSEINDQQPQEPFYAHETWSSAAVVAGRPRADDQRVHPVLDQLRKQKGYSTGYQRSRGDRSRRKSSDEVSNASSRKEKGVRFKLASVAEDEDEEPEPKADERPRQQRSKTSPSRIETVNGKSEHTKSEHTKSEHIKSEHSKSEHSKSEHSKSEHSKSEHNESPRKKKSKHPKEGSPSESSSSPSKSSPSARTTTLKFPVLPEIAPLEPLYIASLQPEYDTPQLGASSRIPPIHTRAVPMETIYRVPLQPQYPPSAVSFSYHAAVGRRRQDEFVPIYRRQPDHRAYGAFVSEPAPAARFTDSYGWRDNMYAMGQQSFYVGTGRL